MRTSRIRLSKIVPSNVIYQPSCDVSSIITGSLSLDKCFYKFPCGRLLSFLIFSGRTVQHLCVFGTEFFKGSLVQGSTDTDHQLIVEV